MSTEGWSRQPGEPAGRTSSTSPSSESTGIPLGYYRHTLAAEGLIEQSGPPWTALRTPQSHDLIRVLLARAGRSPLMPVLDIRVQPIDVCDLAARLA
jgi:uncharacterized protein YbjT (DUF2867 family)